MVIKVGDYVTVGNNELTWQVVTLDDKVAGLHSGQTGRKRAEWVINLKPFEMGGKK
jgi:hypothetical protein